jgi:neurotransmitter:Na+ symporter, NSS family
MPLLILFAVFLAVRALTLDEGEYGAVNDAIKGLNFLWEPQFDSLTNPKIWLAAAGQVFFTLSLGMGSIHCYASYLKENHDIALNASAAGWLNEAVEVILGGSIIIPIAVAYLGVDWIQQHVGFEMGFRTMPFLFQQWGPVLGAIAGLLWFGLLFFAGITSSLAMGQPVLAFLQDAFKIQRKPSALIFGGIVLFLATPCVLFYSLGSFDEFDYWVGTFSLVLLALTESILFAWVFGMKKGWVEITRGADIVVPDIFRYILKYVTPVFLIMVFTASLIKPEGGNWASALTILRDSGSWTFASDSVIGNLLHYGIQDTRWFINGVPTKLFITDATRLLLTIVFLIIGTLTVKIALNNDNNKE